VFLQSTALLFIILELPRLEYYITGYALAALLHCTAVTSWILLYRPDPPVAPMQVNRSWSLWDLI